MKLFKHDFALLIAKIQSYLSEEKRKLTAYDIEDIDNLIDFDVPTPDMAYSATSDVNRLMELMAAGGAGDRKDGPSSKIEAIKMHRKLTGWGLKESKDQVAKYWVSKPDIEAEPKLATIEQLKDAYQK